MVSVPNKIARLGCWRQIWREVWWRRCTYKSSDWLWVLNRNDWYKNQKANDCNASCSRKTICDQTYCWLLAIAGVSFEYLEVLEKYSWSTQENFSWDTNQFQSQKRGGLRTSSLRTFLHWSGGELSQFRGSVHQKQGKQILLGQEWY